MFHNKELNNEKSWLHKECLQILYDDNISLLEELLETDEQVFPFNQILHVALKREKLFILGWWYWLILAPKYYILLDLKSNRLFLLKFKKCSGLHLLRNCQEIKAEEQNLRFMLDIHRLGWFSSIILYYQKNLFYYFLYLLFPWLFFLAISRTCV